MTLKPRRSSEFETEIGSLEQWKPVRKFGLILLCRTIEHLQDLRGGLEKIRRALSPKGLFYCDIVDFGRRDREGGLGGSDDQDRPLLLAEPGHGPRYIWCLGIRHRLDEHRI